MPCITYVEKRFNTKARLTIERANAIISEYEAKGFSLTLRQLYYQFVSRDFIPNNLKSYKSLGNTISDARLAGLIDWEAIEDRTRFIRRLSHWASPSDVIASAAQGYHRDLWDGQYSRVEVWIEKDALVGVIERVCNKWDVPFFSCRGYASQSEVWRAAQRHREYDGDSTVVIHLGDHDPSGIDMTRDIQDRLELFGANTVIRRIALNMDQVIAGKLPPNPAKPSDARYADYKSKHGEKCWELDALDPSGMEKMIDKEIRSIVDMRLWENAYDDQETERSLLTKASDKWPSVVKQLQKLK